MNETLNLCGAVGRCPMNYAMSLIGGKWKMQILCSLNSGGTMRYNALKRRVAGISNTVLAAALRELEAGGKNIWRCPSGWNIPSPRRDARWSPFWRSSPRGPKSGCGRRQRMKQVEIYTDGSCSGNPGPGGWGAILRYGEREKELSGGAPDTTNNRMELTAAIMALTAIYNTERFKGRTIAVYSDSQYVKNGITSWIHSWKKNGWRTSQKKPVLNQELWQQLDALNAALSVQWNWVKGHAGVHWNERCDQLCQEEIAKFEK